MPRRWWDPRSETQHGWDVPSSPSSMTEVSIKHLVWAAPGSDSNILLEMCQVRTISVRAPDKGLFLQCRWSHGQGHEEEVPEETLMSSTALTCEEHTRLNAERAGALLKPLLCGTFLF